MLSTYSTHIEEKE